MIAKLVIDKFGVKLSVSSVGRANLSEAHCVEHWSRTMPSFNNS
jgi:hypothetical protein